MKHLFETLSDNGIQKLTDYLKSAEGLDDSKIDEYIKILSKHAKKSGIKQDDYETFFKNHGLSELNWGRKNSAVKQFVNLFSEDEHLDILSDIIKNNGTVSIDDVKETGNIFKDYCKGWEDEAKTIATWTNSKSANAGPCEMLLKFILHEGNSRTVGDVGIDDEEMEVKAGTLKGKQGSGGHAAGQKGNIRKTWSVYYWLDKYLFNLETSNKIADSRAYFQNDNGVKDFNKKLEEAGLLDSSKYEIISNEIVNALCFQYDKIKNDETKNNDLDSTKLKKLQNASLNFIKDKIGKEGFNKQDLLNLVGCIQLYLYSQIENFDYFFAVLIDKNIDNESENNGFYICVKDCKDDNTKLLHFNEILEHLKFGPLDSTTSTQGRTGKIYIVK
jgi:hypothetical protein